MRRMKKHLGLHFYVLCLVLAVVRTKAAVPMLYHCSNDSSYNPEQDPGKTYRANLIDFLYAAVDDSRTSFFHNSTYGDDPSNRVYGLFMCKGDVTGDVCSNCITKASKEVLNNCLNQMVAYTWYDECFLRYSNRPLFAVLDASFGVLMWNANQFGAEEQGQFKQVLADTMQKAADGAANDTRPDKKFGVEEAPISSSQSETLYTLAQCTPDLSKLDCQTCLRFSISQLPICCNNSRGGRVAFPSCNIRYELYRFYNITQGPAESDDSEQPGISPPAPEPAPAATAGKAGISVLVAIAIASSIVSCILLFLISFVFLKRRSMKKKHDAFKRLEESDEDDITIDPESLQYSLIVIKIATNNFSADNKIGQGGFGGVYKGELPNGQVIAVKRLSKSSGQGAAEFKNEIAVVAKLQHRNLVRLLGFCLEAEEKILVYEFVPKRSLDYFLFDPEKQGLLNWSRRHNIIGGIARGLLYLHEDSRLKIVHRDLKAGNILLDESMHPKIADFGMAKICEIHESEGNTTRIAGTFGYMAPEYTRSGQYSVKSDVFSFGVVILEIITGKRNSSFYQSEDSEDLLSYAWRQWRNGRALALLDPTIGESYVKSEVIQCVHIGLLCVEEDASKRPTMASVVYMLNSTAVSLPTPQRPAVLREYCTSESRPVPEELRSHDDHQPHDANVSPESVNEATITQPYPR